MPTYAPCQIATKLGPLEKGGNKQDTAVVAILKEGTKIAIENTKLYKAEIDRLKGEGKAALAAMEARLNQMKSRTVPDPTDLTTIKAGVDVIDLGVKAAATEGKNLMAALAEYRGGWDITAKKLVADPKTVELYGELRKKQINDMKLIKAEEARLEEFLNRARLVVKNAEDAGATTAKATNQIKGEVDGLLKQIQDHAEEIDTAIHKDANKFNTFEKMFKGKTLDSKQMLDAEGLSKHLEAGRKGIKGSAKTLKAEFDRLQAVAKPRAFIFKTQLDEATQVQKGVDDKVKDFEAKCADVAKEVEALKKRVK